MPSDTLHKQISGNISAAAETMRALSNETRILLMCKLMETEMSVNELAEAVDMRLPAVSQHLGKMRSAGLVSTRREAQTVYYRANAGVGQDIVGTLCQYFKKES